MYPLYKSLEGHFCNQFEIIMMRDFGTTFYAFRNRTNLYCNKKYIFLMDTWDIKVQFMSA